MNSPNLINGRAPAHAGQRTLFSGMARDLQALQQTLETAGNNLSQARPPMACLYREQAAAVAKVAERFQALAAKGPAAALQNDEPLTSQPSAPTLG